MIQLMYSNEKTNSFRPTPWHFSQTPFPAYRGAGARYNAFQSVSKDYTPKLNTEDKLLSDWYQCPRMAVDEQCSKIIHTTAKNTRLIIPCEESEDEKIMLLTLRGWFRWGYSRIVAQDSEILSQVGGNIHCCPTEHIVARVQSDLGYIFAETGRRGSTWLVEIFSWKDGYSTMPTQEFEVWQEIQQGSL